MASTKFTVHTQEEQADSIAIKLPDGLLYMGKFISNTTIRKWLLGIGFELIRLEEGLNYADGEFNLLCTNDLIGEFENDYAINDSCFQSQNKNDLEQRVQNILTLISANGVSTNQELEDLAAVLGMDVTVISSNFNPSIFPLTFPFIFGNDPFDDRFTFYVIFNEVTDEGFPYTFPITFQDALNNILKCFFELLKPANCRIVYL